MHTPIATMRIKGDAGGIKDLGMKKFLFCSNKCI